MFRNDSLNESMTYFNEHKYQECINSLKNKNTPAAKFYIGLSYMELEKFNYAATQFEDIIKTDDVLYSTNSKWYLGLCYLKLSKKDDAIKLFKELQNNNYYKNKATEILNDIN